MPDEFQNFIEEIKYATNLVRKGKYDLGEYYEHMAKFFDHIKLPQDAEEHRLWAMKWKKEKGTKNVN
tara:strand:+ start:402 stop:602 length:201 start_codon:yes stop_codon:yes gene_type:complete